jgi:hypothetical protein
MLVNPKISLEQIGNFMISFPIFDFSLEKTTFWKTAKTLQDSVAGLELIVPATIYLKSFLPSFIVYSKFFMRFINKKKDLAGNIEFLSLSNSKIDTNCYIIEQIYGANSCSWDFHRCAMNVSILSTKDYVNLIITYPSSAISFADVDLFVDDLQKAFITPN